MDQISGFSAPDAEDITDLQVETVYKSLFDLKRDQKKIEECDLQGVIERLSFCTKYGCKGMGIGWSEENPTIVDISREGIEFNHNGKIHSFPKIALALVKNYGMRH